MSQANNGKQSSSLVALSPFLCFHSIFLGKQSLPRLRAASLSHHDLTFEKQTSLAGGVGVKRQWAFWNTDSRHPGRANTHMRTHTHKWCATWSCQNPSVYPSPISETIEESRRLKLNGAITAAASKLPLPASHNELNNLFHCTHFCHSNLVSHSAPKHDYFHSGSRVAKCLLLVIYASIFLLCVCVGVFRVLLLPGVVAKND